MQYLSRTNLPTDALICFAISAGCANVKWVLQHYGGFCNVCKTQNRFSSNNLSLHTKTYYSEHDKNINLFVIFSFFHRAVEKHEHYMTYFLSSANIVL
jgi:hypothetical protein